MKGEVKQINGKRVATTEYRSWQMMKNRCLNPKAQDFRYYGGRGITICRRWLLFDNFLADMGRKPHSKLTLERKDTNKGYYKRNCIWATRQQQAQNRNYCGITAAVASAIRLIYAAGRSDQQTLAQKFNVTQSTISQVLRGSTWKNAIGPLVQRSNQYRVPLVGELNGRAKVTDVQAAQIRALVEVSCLTQKQIGLSFGLSQTQISKICRRKEAAQ